MIQRDVPLAPLTSFNIGGAAQHFVEVNSEAAIKSALEQCQEKNMKLFILAGGSNVVVPDAGIPGCVIHIAEGVHDIQETKLTVFAGCNLLQLINKTAESGLTGWEHMAGIPGTLGGAVRGNAGAFGTEIKDVLEQVEALHRVTLEKKSFTNTQCAFAYRTSFFKQHPEWIITQATIQLQRGNSEKSLEDMQSAIQKREQKHIQNVRSAGSFFLNPVAPREVIAAFEKEKGVQSRKGRVPAGWLIEKSGMKGVRVGGVKSSEHQANYFVNVGGATAKDVRELATQIKERVYAEYAIALHEEPTVV